MSQLKPLMEKNFIEYARVTTEMNSAITAKIINMGARIPESSEAWKYIHLLEKPLSRGIPAIDNAAITEVNAVSGIIRDSPPTSLRFLVPVV